MPDINYTLPNGKNFELKKIKNEHVQITKGADKPETISFQSTVENTGNKNHNATLLSNTHKKKFWIHHARGKRILAWAGGSLEIDAQELSDSAAAAGKILPLKITMPGKVLDIKVKTGDLIEPGQALIVVEAMKMENILMATAHAKVSKIHVQINDRLESGALLISFEDAKA